MKKLAQYFILSISLLSLVAIYSCSNESNEIPTNSSVNNEYSNMVFPNFNDIIWEEVSGGTIESEFNVIQLKGSQSLSDSKKPGIQCDDNDDDGDGNIDEDHDSDDDDSDDGEDNDCDDDDDDEGCCYGSILSQLNLTVDQFNQIHQFKEGFEDCVEIAEDNYENSKHSILFDANQQRNDILQQLENGTITEEQAAELLYNLKAQTIQQITDLKTAFKAAAGECLCNFLKNVISIMDDVQKETFITWVETNSCIDVNCDLRGTSLGNQF